MAIINRIPQGAEPGARVAAIAEETAAMHGAFNEGKKLDPADEMLYKALSEPQCWNAAVYCAWLGKGIECDAISVKGLQRFNVCTFQDWRGIFPAPTTVRTMNECLDIPPGAFVGFINNVSNVIRHCMINIGKGYGAGNKNDCIFTAGSTIGWERLDMTEFFRKDVAFGANVNTRMVWQAVKGQKIAHF